MGSKIKLDQCTIERLKFVFLSINISDYIAVFNDWRQFDFSVQCLLHLEIYINEGVVYIYLYIYLILNSRFALSLLDGLRCLLLVLE